MGAITQGVLGGLAASREAQRLMLLKENQQRQAVNAGIQTLNQILGMENKKQRNIMLDQFGQDIGRMIGRPIAPAVLEMLKASDEDQVGTLRAMFSEMGLQGDPAQLMSVMGSPYEALKFAMKFQQGQQAAEQEKVGASIFGRRLPGQEAAAPTAPQQPPKDFTLRTGPAGEALGMEPAPPMAPQGDPMLQQQAAPAPPAGPQDQLALLDQQENALIEMVREAQAAGIPIDESRKRGIDLRLAAIERQRTALRPDVKGTLTEIIGPDGKPMRTVVDTNKLGPVGEVPKTTPVGTLSERVAAAERAASANPQDARAQAELAQARRALTIETGLREAGAEATARGSLNAKLDAPISMEDAKALGVPAGTLLREVRGLMPQTTAQQTAREAFKGTKAILSRLNVLADTVFTAEGLAGRLAQLPRTQWGLAMQTDEDAVLYQSLSGGVLANMVRAFGERGTLTDQDIARARALLPTLGNMVRPPDSKSVAKGKLKQLDKLIAEIEGRPAKPEDLPAARREADQARDRLEGAKKHYTDELNKAPASIKNKLNEYLRKK